MSMTPPQARRLGVLLTAAREVRGMSLRELAAAVSADHSWIAKLERGEFFDPSPKRLARIVEFLELDPARVNAIGAGVLGDSLPTLNTYFRAKYNLPPEAISYIESYIEHLRNAPEPPV